MLGPETAMEISPWVFANESGFFQTFGILKKLRDNNFILSNCDSENSTDISLSQTQAFQNSICCNSQQGDAATCPRLGHVRRRTCVILLRSWAGSCGAVSNSRSNRRALAGLHGPDGFTTRSGSFSPCGVFRETPLRGREQSCRFPFPKSE